MSFMRETVYERLIWWRDLCGCIERFLCLIGSGCIKQPLNEKHIEKVIADSINSTGNDGIHLIIAMEELSELQKEISKELRGKGDKVNVLEELADVQIVIYYVKKILGISNEDIEKAISVKIDRLASIVYKE